MYWSERKKQLDESLAKDEKRLFSKMTNYYEREAAKLDKEIASYYAKYGNENVIEYRKLLESLSDKDKNLLIERMDDFAKKYPEYEHLMPVRESIYKLNRIEGLRESIALQQIEIGVYEQQQAKSFFEKQALNYANGAAIQLGFGKNFYSIDHEMIKLAVGNKWCDGKDFSERIWDNKDKLTRSLQNEVVNGFIRGDSYHKTSKIIQEKFQNVSKKDIERLVYTENTYLSNESAMKVFESDGVTEEYTFSSALDNNTCSMCRNLNGETFKIKDRCPGLNFPPMHPWCRCFFEPVVFDDWRKYK